MNGEEISGHQGESGEELMTFKVGVDVGGTFIDLIVVDESGRSRLYKTLSDPKDLAGAVLEGLTVVAGAEGMSLREMLAATEIIIHGSTVATNALLTKNGARTALLTTAGFRDVLNMRRGIRDNLYDPKQIPPAPLIPRQRIYPVEERIDCEGSEVIAVNDDALDAVIKKLVASGVESIAIGFLFSFLDNSHEQHVGRRVQELMPHAHISLRGSSS